MGGGGRSEPNLNADAGDSLNIPDSSGDFDLVPDNPIPGNMGFHDRGSHAFVNMPN